MCVVRRLHARKLYRVKRTLGMFETSHLCRVETKEKPLFERICIELDATQMGRLRQAYKG